MHSEPCKTSKMELLAKIVIVFDQDFNIQAPTLFNKLPMGFHTMVGVLFLFVV